jgi:hypothetical protein
MTDDGGLAAREPRAAIIPRWGRNGWRDSALPPEEQPEKQQQRDGHAE